MQEATVTGSDGEAWGSNGPASSPAAEAGSAVFCRRQKGRDAAARFRRNHGLGGQLFGDPVAGAARLFGALHQRRAAVIEQETPLDVAVLDVGPAETARPAGEHHTP